MIHVEKTNPLPAVGGERRALGASSWSAALRLGDWWPHLVPVVVACLYGSLVLGAEPAAMARKLPGFLVALVALATFGYTLNDLCDAAQDRRAGKPDALAGAGGAKIRLGLVVVSLAVGLVAWATVEAPALATGFLALHLLLLMVYSVPPLRWKERGLLGVLADALYGHLLPVAITLLVFAPAPDDRWLGGAVIVWALAKGLRNILLHQIEDRKGDRRAGIATFGSSQPPLRVLSLVNRLFLPVEIVTLVLLLVALAPAWWGLVAFTAFTLLKFSAWKLWFLPRRYRRLKFVWCLNDFYEEWLGPVLILVLAARDPLWVLLLPLHLLLFPRLFGQMSRDLPAIWRNLRD
ncbi:MAG: UbiA family prenyltransferase [Acidobacteriota bacterium]